MTLNAKVTARYSNEDLIRMTNPKNSNASTVDSTRLTNAVNDVLGMFKIYVNAAYDDDDTAHVAVAVKGVALYLREYQGFTDVSLDAWIERLKDLGQIEGRNRISPQSSSVKTRSTDDLKKIDFDRDESYENLKINRTR
jgi:hypothetical protein